MGLAVGLGPARFTESTPADLAFVAMASHRLARKEDAEGYLKRLREAVKKPRWAKDEPAQELHREAEELLGGPNGR